ncbi:Serine/threonine-protein kinase PknK [Planctomycetaceae bacterium]|nr:Serine/threonine-protein kinase PknK [Planctomycetaceae bacterium]
MTTRQTTRRPAMEVINRPVAAALASGQNRAMMNLSTNRVFGPGHVRSAPDHQVPHSCHARPRLQQRLAEALTRERSLIVISAPAGFGKTTLLSEWLQHLSLPSSWLSLDAADNDMARFLAYLSAALHKIHPEGAQLRAATPRAASLPETESLLTALVMRSILLPGPACWFSTIITSSTRPPFTLRWPF